MDDQKPFKKVGTHHGRFHADEVMATAILEEIFDIDVVRTRNNEVLKGLDIVYDVGGGEFDHHHVDKTYRKNGVPYAACGLIWKEFGRDVILSRDKTLSQEEVDSAFRYVDTVLVEGIDAIDNGLKTSDTIVPTMNISSIISGFNPPWYSEMSEDLAFNDAVDFASEVLKNTLNQKFSVLKARENVALAYENRMRNEILVLDTSCPWARTLKDIDADKEVLFVVYPNKEGYAIQTVRKEGKTFKARKDLPKSWAGKRDEELGETIGIDDAVFCHPSRFIAGAKSFDSIMKMADMAVQEPPDSKIQSIFFIFKRLLPWKR